MPRPPAPKASTKPKGPPMSLIGGVTAFVVAVIAVLVYLAVRGDGTSSAGSAGALPDGGGVVVNADAPDDAAEVHLYEDFQCPFCGQLEQSAGGALTQAAADGTIKLTYTFMSFLDGASGNSSSSRAANAALCANDAGIFEGWVQTTFDNQPEEGVGYTDEELVGFAEQGGLSSSDLTSFESCVTGMTYQDYVADMQEAANRAQVTSTPTIEINGEQLDSADVQRLQSDPTSLDAIVSENS